MTIDSVNHFCLSLNLAQFNALSTSLLDVSSLLEVLIRANTSDNYSWEADDIILGHYLIIIQNCLDRAKQALKEAEKACWQEQIERAKSD